jgi:hypothetical protein
MDTRERVVRAFLPERDHVLVSLGGKSRLKIYLGDYYFVAPSPTPRRRDRFCVNSRLQLLIGGGECSSWTLGRDQQA